MSSASLRQRIARALRGTPVERVAWGLRDVAEGALSVARAPVARRRRVGSAVLMYHGVTREVVDPLVEVAHLPASLFRRQIRHLKRHYRVVPLAEVVERVDRGRPVPDDWAVLTFDDGYRNNLTCAREILREEGNLPMSIFVVTEFVGTRSTLLTTLTAMTFACVRADRLRVPRPDGEWEWRGLESRRARVNAYWEMLPVLKSLPVPEQQAVAAEFFAQLGDGELEEIRARFPSHDWLDWNEVRELHADGVDVGSHTRTHVSLRSELGHDRIREEVEGSRRRLEKEIGVSPAHFAYPNGKPEDLCEVAEEEVRNAGYRCALTTIRGTVEAGSDLHHLRRLTGCIDSMARFRMANASGFR